MPRLHTPILLLLTAGALGCAESSRPSFAYTSQSTNGSLPSISWGSTGSGGTGGSDDTGGSGDTGDTGAAITGTGYSAGDVAYSLQATNQIGGAWSLYDQQGQAVVLLVGNADVGASFTTPLAAMQDLGGVQTVVLMGRNEYSVIATREDAARYASAYSVDTVLIDPLLDSLVQWGGESTPRLYLIGPDLVIDYAASGAAVTAADLQRRVTDLLAAN